MILPILSMCKIVNLKGWLTEQILGWEPKVFWDNLGYGNSN